MEERSNSMGNGGQEHAVVRPIKVALVNDYEIILRGLHSMLAPFSDRIEVVEHDTAGTRTRTPTWPCSTRSRADVTRWNGRDR